MSPTVATFLFETVNFVLLAVFLGWVFTKPMRRLLDDELAARADANRAVAAREAEVDGMRAELSKRLAAIDEESARSRERERSRAQKEAAAIVDAARERAVSERARAVREAEARQREEVHALTAELGKLAEKLVLELFARGAGAEADVAFARAAGGKLSALAEKARAHAGALVIECARPLSPELRGTLESLLGPALDRAEVRVVPDLVAGVRVVSDAGLVDASARGLARHAETALRDIATDEHA